MELRAGTSGFSYAEWKGVFYPEKLPAREMLGYYAQRLPSVEINNTFYRLPKASVLEAWAGQVPASFRFAVKASRRITHFARLKGAEEETAYLLETLGALGDQLPPNLPCDHARLEAFLALLPEGGRHAFEFRHASWLAEPGVRERLRVRNAAWVLSDTGDEPVQELVACADWGYLRLRRPGYGPAELAAWLERIRATGWREAYVFFKHEDEAAGPRMAEEFLKLRR
jgi:uncharacterized protein YecE (DUF72 family)